MATMGPPPPPPPPGRDPNGSGDSVEETEPLLKEIDEENKENKPKKKRNRVSQIF